jgi:hypothetical protein
MLIINSVYTHFKMDCAVRLASAYAGRYTFKQKLCMSFSSLNLKISFLVRFLKHSLLAICWN